jgi:hypothetical protein
MDARDVTNRTRRAWNIALINAHGGRWLPFDKLPEEAMSAAVVMQFGTGTRWNELDPEDIISEWETMSAIYGQKEFGLARVPTDLLKRYTLEFQDKLPSWIRPSVFGNFEAYAKWYASAGNRVPKHKVQWPCILSEFDDELFEDGWRRFHAYVKQRRPTTPVLLFPK